MNSLVVFLSVVALAVAKPSHIEQSILTYSSPIIAAAPAAVSHQSRLDIKSSPAVVSTAAIAPAATTYVAQPVLAAPAIATAAIAPAAVSSQSRIDIKSTPAVTSTVVSAAPVAYSAPAITYSSPAIAYSSPALAYSGAYAYNSGIAYNGAYAYGAPILKTAYTAPAILKTTAIATPAGAHLIRKRSAALYSAPVLSSPIATTYTSGPIVTSYAAPLTYSAPLALSTPLITKAYGVHPW